MNTSIKRIHSDLNGVQSLQSCGIYVHAHEDDITKIDAIIEGPDDTPYQGGYFYFKLKFPNDYPLSSPKVQLQTTDGGRVRFNPNLYACGKVCLSILGTWQGPSWTAGLTLSTVLLSIQSLMCEYPMRNEPGFTSHQIQSELEAYNMIIRHETLRVAAFGNVKKILNGLSEIPSELHWGILERFQRHVASGYYERVCNENRRVDGQQMTDPFGESRGQYSFSGLLKEYSLLSQTQSLTNTRADVSTSSPVAEPVPAPVIDLSTDSRVDEVQKIDDTMTLDEEEIEVSEGLKCGICYDVLATAGVLECGHTFCYLCAHKWLMKKSMCPTCRESCQLESLRRIFNLDSLCEKEAQRVCRTPEKLSLWSARKDEGIELANGKRLESTKKKKKKSNFFPHFDDYDSDHDMDLQDEDDSFFMPPPPMGMGMGFSGHYGYFNKFGGTGHVLGKSSDITEEEQDLQHLIQLIESENTSNQQQFTSTSSSSSSHLDPQQLHELRLKRFAASSSSTTTQSSPPKASPAPPKSTQPHHSVPVPSVNEVESAYLRAQKEKQEKELERKRLRLEIARDKEERKQHAGVLPPTHEPILYSKTATETLPHVVHAASSSTNHKSCTSSDTSSTLQSRSERIDSAIETICQHAGLDCTSTHWKETEIALSVLSKILANIDDHPEELKYRSINTTSKIFKEKLSRVGGIQIFLYSVGFIKVSSIDSAGIKQINYTLNDYDREVIQETRTKLLLAIERFH